MFLICKYPNIKTLFYVVRVVHFAMKLYNDKLNAQVFKFNLFIYLLLPYMFWAFFSPFSEAGIQLRRWFKSPGYGISTRALTPYPGDLKHCRSCASASVDGLKESQNM
jgi:hypothetical protein